ncbi:MAG: hypothetical protein HC890_10970 [Chloroflexaceae bacterium]|nr:hypothetical protein [Chloroflexaceae bacterium]
MKQENIIRLTSEQLQNMQGKTDWARVDAMTDEEIEQNALDDPDNLPLSEEMLKKLRPVNPQERLLRRQQQLSNHSPD